MPLTDEMLMQRCKGGLFAIVWIGCLIGLINSVEDTRAFLDAAVAVPGRVVALNAGGSHPQIEFLNRKGERISYPQGGWIAGYKVGDQVNVLYLENSPNPRETIDRVGAIWSLPIFFLGMVTGFPLIWFGKILSKKLRRREGRSGWEITD